LTGEHGGSELDLALVAPYRHHLTFCNVACKPGRALKQREDTSD
jgi:hypothetical protein